MQQFICNIVQLWHHKHDKLLTKMVNYFCLCRKKMTFRNHCLLILGQSCTKRNKEQKPNHYNP